MKIPRELQIGALAMSLYIYNVSPTVRAKKLYDFFAGECAEMSDLLKWVDEPWWAGSMPYPTMIAFLQHAMDRYGEEAMKRIDSEIRFHRETAQ